MLNTIIGTTGVIINPWLREEKLGWNYLSMKILLYVLHCCFRLQYFARGIQGYMKKLRETLQGKTEAELKTDEHKLKVVALKTTTNINTLIKDLFHTPPSFKSNINLSWKPLQLEVSHY